MRLAIAGSKPGERIDVTSHWNDGERHLRGFRAAAERDGPAEAGQCDDGNGERDLVDEVVVVDVRRGAEERPAAKFQRRQKPQFGSFPQAP